EQRAGDAGEAEHGAKDSLVATAVSRWDNVADDRLCRNDQPPAAESLHGAKENQLGHVLREPAQRRAEEEQDYGRLQYDLPPVQIAELAVNGSHDRLCQQTACDDPRQVLQSSELAD